MEATPNGHEREHRAPIPDHEDGDGDNREKHEDRQPSGSTGPSTSSPLPSSIVAATAHWGVSLHCPPDLRGVMIA